MPTTERYSVAINLNDVKDADDLILQLVRIQVVFDGALDWLGRLAEMRGPYPLSQRGVRRFGAIEVVKNG
jgi:hypothetical protein